MSEDKRDYTVGDPDSKAMDTAGAADRPVSWSRRRFGAAAVSTSVIVGLHSNPLRAGNIAGNCTPSGWASGNASIHGEPEDCGANGPEDWASDDPPQTNEQWQDWPIGNDFGSGHYTVEGHPATYLDAVSEVSFDVTTGTQRELLRFGAAAYLNAYFLTYPVDEQTVVDMVSSALNGQLYDSGAGDQLTGDQVLSFLKNTMGYPQFFGQV